MLKKSFKGGEGGENLRDADDYGGRLVWFSFLPRQYFLTQNPLEGKKNSYNATLWYLA